MNKSGDKVSIILLNYNSFKDTIECVLSLNKHIDHSNYQIVIVDNASTDGSSIHLKQFLEKEQLSQVHFIQSEVNGGFSNGNNLGIQFAINQLDAEFIWLLNNDTVIKEDALSPLLKAMKSNKEIGILGSLLLFYHDTNVIQASGGSFYPKKARIVQEDYNMNINKLTDLKLKLVDFPIGASMFVSKEFLDKVGYLSEDYFLYFEELDWAERAKLKGYKCFVELNSKVFHKQGASTKNQVYSKKNLKMMYYQFRNLITFYKKYYPSLSHIAYFMVMLRAIKFAFIQDPKFLCVGIKACNYHLR